MGKTYEALDDRLRQFIESQKMFFVATAPLSESGHVNVSPKGLDSFTFFSADTVGYLDFGGSGIETQAHIQENGRITIMFCAFDGKPYILRLYGTGKVIDFDHPEFESMLQKFPGSTRARAVIQVKITRIQDSCGWGVPLYEFVGDRDQLTDWLKNPFDEWKEKLHKTNAESLDGLPGLNGPQK